MSTGLFVQPSLLNNPQSYYASQVISTEVISTGRIHLEVCSVKQPLEGPQLMI